MIANEREERLRSPAMTRRTAATARWGCMGTHNAGGTFDEESNDSTSTRTRQRRQRVAKSASPSVAKTRGFNFLSALAFVHRRGGRQAIADVLRVLPEEDLRQISEDSTAPNIQPRGWYPFTTYCRMLAGIDTVLGNGDREILYEVGNEMATRDIRRIFRPLLRVGRPGWILEFHGRLWRTYHDHGEWTIDRTPVSLIATLSDHPGRTEHACATFTGWMESALLMSGAANVDGSHPVCIGRGGPHCVFTCRWEMPRSMKNKAAPSDSNPERQKKS